MNYCIKQIDNGTIYIQRRTERKSIKVVASKYKQRLRNPSI